MTDENAKVIIGVSGGVDSAVATLLLKQQGHDVRALHLLLPMFGDDRDGASEADARRVAEHLGIPLMVQEAREDFEEEVLRHFARSYASGRTPNPCVRCNPAVKFRRLLAAAEDWGAAAVATGHYVASATVNGRHAVRKGPGGDDQSYFLAGLSQEQLARALFPLAGLTKQQVRHRAKAEGIPVHDRPDSQDLCFLASGHYREFLLGRVPEAFQPGPIVHVSGEVLGQHDGIAGYTVGQRRGLGIAHSEPLYVVRLRPEDNAVVVGEERFLYGSRLLLCETNWMAVPPPEEPLCARVRVRYNHAGGQARIVPLEGDRVRVEFTGPQKAPAPGQAAIFYRNDLVLGGGTIDEVLE